MSIQAYLVIQTLGFATGAGLFALLSWLFLQARCRWLEHYPARLLMAGGTIAVLCFLWNLTNLGIMTAQICGHAGWVANGTALSFLTLAILPTAFFWFLLSAARHQGIAAAAAPVLLAVSTLVGCVLLTGLAFDVFGAFSPERRAVWQRASGYNQMTHMLVSIPYLFGQWHSAAVRRFCRATWLIGLAGAMLLLVFFIVDWSARTVRVLICLSQQLPLAWALLSFGLFTPFRFADLFVRRGLIATAIVVLAAVMTVGLFLPLRGWGRAELQHPTSFEIVFHVFSLFVLLISSLLTARMVGHLTDRWIFRRPDYHRLLRELDAALENQSEVDDIAERAAALLTRALDLGTVSWRSFRRSQEPLHAPADSDAVPLLVLADGSAVKSRAEPVSGGWVRLWIRGREVDGLAWAAQPASRKLLSREIRFLEDAAHRIVRRLDALRHTREIHASHRRAVRLEQSVAEAELKALRAQIDPHFLFNTLNTIAELIRSDPDTAERMTERLAATFRFLLARSDRQTIPLGEEVQFIRHYLDIERERFGERLSVTFNVDPALHEQHVPTLLLQPLVENALRHGLAPKVAGGHLRIGAATSDHGFQIVVADDGVGFDPSANGAVQGHDRDETFGLRATRERIHSFFGERAALTVQSEPNQGTCVTIRVERQPCR